MVEVRFEALPNTTPVPFEQRTGCTWPIDTPHGIYFCNEPKVDGGKKFGWCAAHAKRGCNAPRVTLRGKGVR